MEKIAAQPWQQFHRCAGTIIDKVWILTTQECVPGDGMPNLRSSLVVVAGVTDLRAASLLKQVREIAESFVHDGVALVRLKQPLDFGKSVNVVILPSSSEKMLRDPKMMKALGFGQPEKSVERLRIITVNEDKKHCDGADHVLNCWTVSQPGMCLQDDGGPLMYPSLTGDVKIVYVQLGINMYAGDGPCDKPGDNAIFLRVSEYCQWIETTVGRKVCRELDTL
ncbi:unnamed protein product, partial [Mesorhabditis spiculigera]